MISYVDKYGRRKAPEKWTTAIVSYTKDGVRHTEEKATFNKVYSKNKYELKQLAETKYGLEKVFVHSIVRAHYFEA